MTPDMIYDSPAPDGLALEREAVILPALQRGTFMTSMKFRRWQLHCGGFCSYPDCDPAP